MTATYLQKDKGHLNLCVCSKYRNKYFLEVKNQVKRYLDFFNKNGIIELKLIQSNISESCYLELIFNNSKRIRVIRISSHASSDFNDYDFAIDGFNNIKNELHFNKLTIELIKREF